MGLIQELLPDAQSQRRQVILELPKTFILRTELGILAFQSLVDGLPKAKMGPKTASNQASVIIGIFGSCISSLLLVLTRPAPEQGNRDDMVALLHKLQDGNIKIDHLAPLVEAYEQDFRKRRNLYVTGLPEVFAPNKHSSSENNDTVLARIEDVIEETKKKLSARLAVDKTALSFLIYAMDEIVDDYRAGMACFLTELLASVHKLESDGQVCETSKKQWFLLVQLFFIAVDVVVKQKVPEWMMDIVADHDGNSKMPLVALALLDQMQTEAGLIDEQAVIATMSKLATGRKPRFGWCKAMRTSCEALKRNAGEKRKQPPRRAKHATELSRIRHS